MNRKIEFSRATADNSYSFTTPSHGFDINIELIYLIYLVWCEYLIEGWRVAWETSRTLLKKKYQFGKHGLSYLRFILE